MKKFWIGLVLMVLGIGFGVLMVFTIMEDMIFLGSALLFLVAMLLIGGFSTIKAAVTELQELLQAEKLTGETKTKKQITKHVSVTVITVILIGAAALFISGSIEGTNLNNYAEYMLRNNDDATDNDYIKKIEESLANAGPIARNFFFEYDDEIQSRKDAYQLSVQSRAKEISEKIDKLEECSKIDSASHYAELSSAINELKLDSADSFDAEVLQLVSNYDKLTQHEQKLETVRAQYCHTCGDCNGNGVFSCGSCGGAGRYSCSSCGGSGKILVTWYSHGDWGETSYTSYKCSSCNGKGKADCSSCSSGKKDCTACDDGNIYIYEDGIHS